MIFQIFKTTLILFGISGFAETKDRWSCVSPKAACDLNTCLPLSLCPGLLIGNITVNSTKDEIPEELFCQDYQENHPCVCCPSFNINMAPEGLAPIEDGLNKNDLLPPSFECCDRPVLYIYGGESIGEGEFPSLAVLLYVDSNGKSSVRCAGTLISKQYVLTAAHCVTGKILQKAGKLKKIRLGEHDLSDTICENGKCSDGTLEFDIEKVIIHEGYDDDKKPHDIALIRLAKALPYFQFQISPICLRWVHRSPAPVIEANHTFTVVGWGRTLSEKQSNIGNKVSLPYYDRNQCAERYKKHDNITEMQICAGGEFKIDSCDGDSGGPLISKIGNCDYLDGIVSYGKGCGLENEPGVYTNVTAYRDWIMQNIDP